MKPIQKYFCLLILFLLSNAAISQSVELLKFEPISIKGTSGYFRVGKTTDGQWWFLDPSGKPFYYRGVCAVNRAGTAGGRRATPGRYAVTVDRKYNYQQSPDSFVNASISKMRDLGFNALGAWATEEFFNRGIPFTEILEFFLEPPFLPSATGTSGLPDIFHRNWQIAIDRKARAICSPLRTSKDLVGYFTDNEIGFGKADDFGLDLGFQAGQFDFSLLRLVLGMNSGEPAFEFAWNFVLNRHEQSFAKLSAAWQVNISSNEDIRKLNQSKTPISGEAFLTDAQAFVECYARRYFELVNRAIRRYDPNHLILGCRFGAPPPTYVLDAIKPWTDVISANNYQPNLYERYDTVYQYTGLPILIGEFSWNTDLYKKLPIYLEPEKQLTNKERMFLKGKETIRRTCLHDGIVGFTWYRWVQGTCTTEKFYDGIVNYGDSLETHSPELKKLVPNLDKLRMEAVGGSWKNSPVSNGEMTLFFDELRPNWNHFLRIGFVDGKPIVSAYGWMMKAKILKFSNKNGIIALKIEVNFEETTGKGKPIEGGKGIYEVNLSRKAEKFHGNFTGLYNNNKVKGDVKAFYFPQSDQN